MFETLQLPRSEPARAGFSPKIYLLYCVLGASGVLISFWKHGTSHYLGLVCYAAVAVLALCFFVAARARRPTSREMFARCVVLLWLSLVPMLVRQLLM